MTMEITDIASIWRKGRKLGDKLRGKDALTDMSLIEIINSLGRFRQSCEQVILGNVKYAIKQQVEVRLWEMHTGVVRPELDRRLLKVLKNRENGGKRLFIEERKIIKAYEDFLRSSQFFFRMLIAKLSPLIETYPSLRDIVLRFGVDPPVIEETAGQVSGRERSLMLQICSQCLVHLGDLSRYREAPNLWKKKLQRRRKNWAPAATCYKDAIILEPASGQPHHQLAAIAIAEADPFHTIYHLYRSLAAISPVQDDSSLKSQSKKLLAASKTKLADAKCSLPDRIARLHAQYVLGGDKSGRFADGEQIVREIGEHLTAGKLEQLLLEPFPPNRKSEEAGFQKELLLAKTTLIGIAAEDYLKTKELASLAPSKSCDNGKGKDRFKDALSSCRRFNLDLFSALLKSLTKRAKTSSEKQICPQDSEGLDVSNQKFLLLCLDYLNLWMELNFCGVSGSSDGKRCLVDSDFDWDIYRDAFTALEKAIPNCPRSPNTSGLEDELIRGFRPLQRERSRDNDEHEDAAGKRRGGQLSAGQMRTIGDFSNILQIARKQLTKERTSQYSERNKESIKQELDYNQGALKLVSERQHLSKSSATQLQHSKKKIDMRDTALLGNDTTSFGFHTADENELAQCIQESPHWVHFELPCSAPILPASICPGSLSDNTTFYGIGKTTLTEIGEKLKDDPYRKFFPPLHAVPLQTLSGQDTSENDLSAAKTPLLPRQNTHVASEAAMERVVESPSTSVMSSMDEPSSSPRPIKPLTHGRPHSRLTSVLAEVKATIEPPSDTFSSATEGSRLHLSGMKMATPPCAQKSPGGA